MGRLKRHKGELGGHKDSDGRRQLQPWGPSWKLPEPRSWEEEPLELGPRDPGGAAWLVLGEWAQSVLPESDPQARALGASLRDLEASIQMSGQWQF